MAGRRWLDLHQVLAAGEEIDAKSGAAKENKIDMKQVYASF